MIGLNYDTEHLGEQGYYRLLELRTRLQGNTYEKRSFELRTSKAGFNYDSSFEAVGYSYFV